MLELVKNITKTTHHQVVLVCLTDYIEYEYVYSLPITLHVIKRSVKKDISTFFKLFSLIKKEHPDLIHSWSSMSNIYTLPIAKLLNIRFITSVIADAPKNMTYRHKAYFRAKMVFPFADRVTSNSLAGLKAYKAPMKKSRCIYNGFDGNRITVLDDAAAIRQQLGIGNKKVIGMVAGFEPRKDYATMIDAACLVLAQYPNVVFLLIGDGGLRESMMRKVPEAHRKQILFLGKLGNVESYINFFDIGVLCTNTSVHQEGISNSILEYMALKKPVIATEGGGTNEIVVDGETGFLVPPHDASVLAGKMLLLLNYPELRQTLGSNSQKRVREVFSIEKMCNQFYSLYDELVKSQPGLVNATIQ